MSKIYKLRDNMHKFMKIVASIVKFPCIDTRVFLGYSSTASKIMFQEEDRKMIKSLTNYDFT